LKFYYNPCSDSFECLFEGYSEKTFFGGENDDDYGLRKEKLLRYSEPPADDNDYYLLCYSRGWKFTSNVVLLLSRLFLF